jgi:RecB family exonuclease
VAREDGNAPASSSLGVLQRGLYRPAGEKVVLDDTVQWVGVRDFLQEAEVAAGMVQRLLEEEPGLKPADIGLLVPDSFEYAVAVEDAFRLGGLTLSGLPVERWRRDLGREVVFHFLYCRQKPAPAMALAVVLSSPLMPWSREQGAELAQAVMDGDYALEPFKDAGVEARTMLELLREGDSEPATLAAALGRLGVLLNGGEGLAEHVVVARAAIEVLQQMLAGAEQLEWTALKRAALPKLVTSGETPEFNLEGVTVWRESQEAWRPVKRLIVLGFAQGHYPAALAANPVFAAEDLEAIRGVMGLPVTVPLDELERRRARFRRQLAAVADEVTFLVTRREFAGKAQGPSESLVFMHQLFAGPGEAEGLVLELDAAEERSHVRHLPLAAAGAAEPPRLIECVDLVFGRDLLELRVDENGRPKPESPSSLETMMVSGLGWLLKRLGAEPLDWAPEEADPLRLGTLAHEVFEGLYAPGKPLPTREKIPERVEALVEEAILRIAPFLRGPQWQIERRNFAALTTKAALAWRDALEQLGAEVVAAEEWLAGEWSGIRVHGQTDLILGLPGNRLLVVDYKRSKSSKRRVQMEKGFDSQASLYRAMIESGGPKNAEAKELATRLKAAKQTGVVYYLLNDQRVLSDAAFPETAAVPGWRAFENDIASEALGRIATRIEEIRAGVLRLNRAGDRAFFEKQAGVTPYALDTSPLIDLFSLPDEEEAEG